MDHKRAARLLLLRRTVVLGVVLLMPLLAIPPVNRCINRWLRPAAKAGSPLASLPPSSRSSDSPAEQTSVERSVSRPASEQTERPEMFAIQARLESLGASYLRLVRLEDGQYQFHCRMAVPGSGRYQRVFEATSELPEQAMRAVLRDVEQWRSSSAQRPKLRLVELPEDRN